MSLTIMSNRADDADVQGIRQKNGRMGEKGDGRLEFGGWIWRYDLAPLGPSETEVTLTYDWSAVPQSIREYLQFPPFGPEHLTNSLHHLAELAAPTSRAWTPDG